jgi:hypothetical protein
MYVYMHTDVVKIAALGFCTTAAPMYIHTYLDMHKSKAGQGMA